MIPDQAIQYNSAETDQLNKKIAFVEILFGAAFIP